MTEDKDSPEPSTPPVPKATEDGNEGKTKKSRWSKAKKKSSNSTSSLGTTTKKSTSKFKGATEGIEEHIFTYDQQMN